jgi:cell division protease FtsH
MSVAKPTPSGIGTSRHYLEGGVRAGPAMSDFDPKLQTDRRSFALVLSVVTLMLFGPLMYAGFGMFFPSQGTSYVEISFSQLVNDADAGHVHDMRINGMEIDGTFSDGRHFQVDAPADPALIQNLYNKGILITKQP